jgi:hypothetical protein
MGASMQLLDATVSLPVDERFWEWLAPQARRTRPALASPETARVFFIGFRNAEQ